MARIIEAKAVISAEDRTGAVFDKIAKKIESIAKSAKTSKEVDQLTKALSRAQEQMSAIDRFGSARGGFADARTKFREAQMAVEKAAGAMKKGEGDARSLATSYEKAQAAVSRAAQAFERQKTAVLQAKSGLDALGVPANRAAAAQDKLRAAVDRTNAALDKQVAKSERSASRRQMVSNAAGLAGGFVAHEAKKGGKAVLHTYREFDKERRFGKAVMGISDEEQKPLVDQAIHLGSKTKYNDVQVLEAQRELAARGLNKAQVMGMIPAGASLGMATDQTLPEAVKSMEGGIFGFGKDTSTEAAALRSARQTADFQVKAMKVSGMTPEDVNAVYKYGAAPSKSAGISEARMLALGGTLKKANIRGDESGTAIRAALAFTQSPTAGAKTAMLANGLDYKNYQTMRDKIDVEPFAKDVAARYGVKLDKNTKAQLGKVFSDKETVADPAKFGPAVTGVLRDSLGGTDAKSLKSIAGAAQRYRNSSVQSVDADRLLGDVMDKIPGNLQFANAVFGSKQGGRLSALDPKTAGHMHDEIANKSDGFADKIANERMAGFDGAISRFEGSVKNLETAIGRAFDKDGKGGILTGGADLLGKVTQGAAELPPWMLGAGASVGAYGALVGGGMFAKSLMGGFGLATSAVALDGSAAALTAAAAQLSAASGIKGVPDAVKTAAPLAAPAGASIWALGAAAAPWLMGGGAIAGGLYAMHKSVQDAGYEGMTSGERLRKQRGSMRDVYRKAFDYPDLSSPALSPTMTYGTGVAGDKAVSVFGEVSGEAKVDVNVTASSSLLEVVKQAQAMAKLSGTVNSSGPGSLGTSSPDAAAHPSGGHH